MYCAGRIDQSRRYSVFVNHNICTVLAESVSGLPGNWKVVGSNLS